MLDGDIPRNFGASFDPRGQEPTAHYNPPVNQAREKTEFELVREAQKVVHQAITKDNPSAIPDSMTSMVNEDIEYLLTQFVSNIQERVNTLREKEFYSLDDFQEQHIFTTQTEDLEGTDSEQKAIAHSMGIEPLKEKNMFRVYLRLAKNDTGDALKSLEADIKINPEKPEHSYAKFLNYQLQGETIFSVEEVPEDNQDGEPEKSFRLDLSKIERAPESL